MSMIDLATGKAYLRLGSSTTQDALVQILIDGSEDWIQQMCGISFGEGVWTEYLDGGTRGLWPHNRPLRAFLSIINRDTPSDAQQEDVDYQVVNDEAAKYSGMYGWALYGATGGGVFGAWAGRMSAIMERWMEGRGRWKVVYTGGYYVAATVSTTTEGPSAFPHYAVPGSLKIAVLKMLRRAFDERGGVKSESAAGWNVTWADLPDTDIMQLISPYMRQDA